MIFTKEKETNLFHNISIKNIYDSKNLKKGMHLLSFHWKSEQGVENSDICKKSISYTHVKVKNVIFHATLIPKYDREKLEVTLCLFYENK